MLPTIIIDKWSIKACLMVIRGLTFIENDPVCPNMPSPFMQAVAPLVDNLEDNPDLMVLGGSLIFRDSGAVRKCPVPIRWL